MPLSPPDAFEYARKAVSLRLALPEASPKVADVAMWLLQGVDKLGQVWDDPHFDGWVQLTFRDGELVDVPIMNIGKRVNYRRYRTT